MLATFACFDMRVPRFFNTIRSRPDGCSMVRELPVEPIVPALATLPIKVLLALGEAATESDRRPIFNLPAAAAAFLGDWSRIRTVLNLRIWAPGWNDDQLRSYVNAAGQKASSRELPKDTFSMNMAIRCRAPTHS